MATRILLPTDGSELSRSAIEACMQLARRLDASVVGLHVMPVVQADILDAWAHHDPQHRERQREVFARIGRGYLADIERAAGARGVPCTCELMEGDDPSWAILKTAEQARCDLIYMASHGCDAESANVLQLLGSETLKVLTHGSIPVMVHKRPRG